MILNKDWVVNNVPGLSSDAVLNKLSENNKIYLVGSNFKHLTVA